MPTVEEVLGGRPTTVEGVLGKRPIREVKPPTLPAEIRAIPPTLWELVTGAIPFGKYATKEGRRELRGEFFPPVTITDPAKLREIEKRLLTEEERISPYESLAREAMSAAEWAAIPTAMRAAGGIVGEAAKLTRPTTRIAKWLAKPRMVGKVPTPPVKPPIEEAPPITPSPPPPRGIYNKAMQRLTPHFIREEAQLLSNWVAKNPTHPLSKSILSGRPISKDVLEVLTKETLPLSRVERIGVPPLRPKRLPEEPPKVPPAPLIGGAPPTPPPSTAGIIREKGVGTVEKILTSPFRLLTGIVRSGPFRALETAANKLLQPEQYLSREPAGQALYDMTIKARRFWRNQLEQSKALSRNITKNLSAEEKEILPTLVDYANEQVQPLANQIYKESGEISDIVDKALRQKVLDVVDSFKGKATNNVINAAKEHITKIARPIWTTAKAFDKEIGQQYGYFTHFPLESELRTLQNEVKALTKQLPKVTGDAAEKLTNEIGNLNAQISHLEKVKTSHLEGLEDTIAALRFRILPSGKYFGPMNEARALHSKFGYDANYTNVMNRYLEGAYRKIFLDRYMPRAHALLDQISDPALRQYAYNHIMAQRGALGAESRLFVSKALEELGLGMHQGAYTQAVNFATRLHYLSKIGLSWIRFPIVNLTQTGNTYAIVGEKAFLKGMARLNLHPREILRIARRFNVISEPEIRGALAEFETAVGKLRGAAGVTEHILSSLPRWSEEANRLQTLAIGLEWAKEQGVKSLHNQIKVALKLIGDTQWIYHKEALPQIMHSPTGRLVMQFRTYTANMVNFMTKALREENYATFARALGLLTVLAGSAAVPFKLYNSVRRGILRNTGRDIGEFSPLSAGTERLGHMIGLENMGVEIGSSFEWLNVPERVSQLFGPTLAPIVEEIPTLFRPEEIPERAKRELEGLAPPITRALKGREVFSKAGRYIGRRRPLERFFLQRPLESVRNEHIALMANAMAYQIKAETQEEKARGREQYNRLLGIARRKGLVMDKYDLAEVKRRARELAGIYEEKAKRKEEITRQRLERD